jgi:hypothetical protein
MAIPAFLIPALTGFAISKLTGASTKKALQSALLGAAVGGVTQGFGAADAAAKASAVNQMEAFGGAANAGKLSSDSGILSSLTKAFGKSPLPDGTGGEGIAGFLGNKIPGLGNTTVGEGALYGVGGKLLYDSFVNSAKAPKKSLFYGANVNYANPAIYNQVGPNKFKVGQYDDQGNMTATSIPGSESYVPPEAVYARGDVPGMPYKVAEQMITAKEGGLATLKGIKKYNMGGQVLPSKVTHDENDINNYVRANGHIMDGTGNGDKDEDTVLAQLADGEFVTRTDGVLGAGIIAGANPNNMKQMREKGAKYFYDQQARFKRVFDLLQQSRAEAA